MTVTEPLLPPVAAVIVALPGATAVTTPDDDTVATLVFELVQVIVRPVMARPEASFGVAVAVVVCPTSSDASPTLAVTDATVAPLTVTLTDPLFPSLVAVIVADPVVTPVTSPDDETVATLVFELVHVTVRPVSTAPAALFVVAVACDVCGTVRLASAIVTVTVATGMVTVTATVPLFPHSPP